MDYAQALGIDLDNPNPIPIEELNPKDQVVVGLSSTPVYVVIATYGEQAWIAQRDQPWIHGITWVRRLRRHAQVIPMEQCA